MNNEIKQHNDATPANGPKLLRAIGFSFSSKVVRAFADFRTTYYRLSDEMKKWETDAAVQVHRDAMTRAKHDPSPEALKAVLGSSRDELVRRYEATHADLHAVRQAQIKKAAPMVLEIRDAITSAIDRHIEKISAENRSKAEQLGVLYSESGDPVLRSISRFRENVASVCKSDGTTNPITLIRLIGEIGGK